MSANPSGMLAPQIRLDASTANGRATVRCKGRLTSDTRDVFVAEIKRLLERSQTLVLDLAELTYMDSNGVGALVSVYTSAQRAECDFYITNPSKRVMDLLHVTNLASLFSGDFTEPTQVA